MTGTCRYVNVVGMLPERKDQLYAPSARLVLRRQHGVILARRLVLVASESLGLLLLLSSGTQSRCALRVQRSLIIPKACVSRVSVVDRLT